MLDPVRLSSQPHNDTDLYAVAGKSFFTSRLPLTKHSIFNCQDFCLIPMGTGHDPSVRTASCQRHTHPTLSINLQVAEYIAECARILEKSGLKYQVRNSHSDLVD